MQIPSLLSGMLYKIISISKRQLLHATDVYGWKLSVWLILSTNNNTYENDCS